MSLPTQTDFEILRALNRLHFLTAAQLTRLLYAGTDENRYARRRLKRLEGTGFIRRIRVLPAAGQGRAPHGFTLSSRGRSLLRRSGIELANNYHRPGETSEAATNLPFLTHSLEAVDILVSVLRLERDKLATTEALYTERQLKRMAVRVPTSTGRMSSVIPDAFALLTPTGGLPVGLSFEVDRGTEEQKRWRAKVDALSSWALGPYQQAFSADNLTIAVLAPDVARVSRLAAWTMAELEACSSCKALSDIFLFTHISPRTVSPKEWFFDSLFLHLKTGTATSLLDTHEGKLLFRPVEQVVRPETANLASEYQTLYPTRRSPV